MIETVTSGVRRRQTLLELCEGAQEAQPSGYVLTPAGRIDRLRFFLCPTATPLFYAAIYRELSESQARRYNQLCGMAFNELVTLFESEFAAKVLGALLNSGEVQCDTELAVCLSTFQVEEQRHTLAWQELNKFSEPDWYSSKTYVVTRPPAVGRRVMDFIAARPLRFTAIFWVMLALEEKAIDVARRCQQADRDLIEPHYREVYRRHAHDEARHVQIDWHLIDRFYARQSPPARRRCAWLVRQMMGRFFLPPNRSAMQVVDRLIGEHPELRPRRAEFHRQLKALAGDPEYHTMMYSRRSTPILFSLLDRFEEMRGMERVLLSYQRAVL